jgi:hypothetical protein
MPYGGSPAVFSLVYSFQTEAGAPPIEIAKLDTQFDDIATGLSNCLLRDGTGLPIATMDWNGQRITGLADAAADTDGVSRQYGDARYAQLGAANTFTGNSILVEGASPEIGIRETDATANNRRWSMSANASTFRLAAVLDDGSPGDSILAADRASGTIVNLTIAGTNTTLVGSTSTTIGNGVGSVIFRDVAGCMRNRGSQNNQTTNNSFLSLQQLGGIENGWVGYGSSTFTLQLANGINGGHVNLTTTGAGEVRANGAQVCSATTLISILTSLDGPGSGVDADLLDGQDGSFYRSAANLNAGNMPDARIVASNVTQHQASLAISGAQVTSGTIAQARLPAIIVRDGVVTPAQITGSVNDYAPGISACKVLRLSTNAPGLNITGLQAGTAGQEILLFNIGANNFNILEESGSSAAANRFATPGGSGIGVAAGDSTILWYDGTSSRWRCIGPN